MHEAAIKKFKEKALIILLPLLALFLLVMVFGITRAVAQAEVTATKVQDPAVIRWAFISVAIVIGMSTLAAGIAVAYVGAAAVGAIGEKPELAGRTLIFVGLAEGIAVWGLIGAILILGKI